MANLSEKVEAELEQVELALRELPAARRLAKLSVLELAGTASLLSAFYHGVENILKQSLLARGVALPAGSAWHRDLLQAAVAHEIISTSTRDRLASYMAFRHFFTHTYGFELDAERLRPLVEDVALAFRDFKTDARRFVRKQNKLEQAKKSLRSSKGPS